MEKFETARRLKAFVEDIRKQYTEDFKAHEMRVRQRAVALYFIDKLALRAGNEKDTKEGESMANRQFPVYFKYILRLF